MNDYEGNLTPRQVEDIERDIRTFHGPGANWAGVAKRINARIDGELGMDGEFFADPTVEIGEGTDGVVQWRVVQPGPIEGQARSISNGAVKFNALEHPLVEGQEKTAQAAYQEMVKRAMAQGAMHRPVPFR